MLSTCVQYFLLSIQLCIHVPGQDRSKCKDSLDRKREQHGSGTGDPVMTEPFSGLRVMYVHINTPSVGSNPTYAYTTDSDCGVVVGALLFIYLYPQNRPGNHAVCKSIIYLHFMFAGFQVFQTSLYFVLYN